MKVTKDFREGSYKLDLLPQPGVGGVKGGVVGGDRQEIFC